MNIATLGEAGAVISVGRVLLGKELAAGAAKETTTLYRAVSRAELDSVAKLGGFSPGPGAMGNKWFAESAADACAWGKKFFAFDKETLGALTRALPAGAGIMFRNNLD